MGAAAVAMKGDKRHTRSAKMIVVLAGMCMIAWTTVTVGSAGGDIDGGAMLCFTPIKTLHDAIRSK